MVAELVAAVCQLVQDGLGQRQTPASLGHCIGHGHRREVDVARLGGRGDRANEVALPG